MSPASAVNELQQDLQLQTLARSFEALLLTIQRLGCKERDLHRRLKYAHDEYLKLANQLPNGTNTHTKIVAEKILGRHPEYEPFHNQSLNPLDVIKALADSGNVGSEALTAIKEGLECCRSINRPDNDKQLSEVNSCYVATRAGVSGNLEKDFTTKGTQGSLRCPFSKPNNKPSESGESNGIEDAFVTQNGDKCGHEDLDPIKAEQNDRRSSLTTSAKSSSTRCPVSRCPIRFMDKHSPEEIADYVERHKHEIPRSHAICVQRYQKDSQTMRQLDAKYGNLISMIQGLSVKHQAFLPGHSQDGAPASSSSAERVEKWAEDVGVEAPEQETLSSANEQVAPGADDDDERKGRFDRPLREVRVGESPSRPWGIPVPVSQPSFTPAMHSPPTPPSDSTKQPLKEPSDLPATAEPAKVSSGMRTGRCPFGHDAPKANDPRHGLEIETVCNETSKSEAADTPRPPHEDSADGYFHAAQINPTSSAKVVFNGPVFFGFSPEQTASFLHKLGNTVPSKPS
ncbi:uncharacterized protein NFIA_115080 [Aspergillus fischeri NRRL 181]|uniref:Uncharacterized protein n=1 Tax=Neosartorya fischeri (strain ATCC 1020 / DSM 3700 / CBS 544.65 / FGSC A1164 / JCM 1740 / NRRL 181 / WB 181) TaxID=331117 RepID=A1D9B1_NEOFI|nr:conserved hypothetical protein [Aspergillus fischeri NRRL 181]EAW20972.1 conserved hypothetical protein [Aspergillus fischeri NRRL 181]KAG2006609.1 hypothetical protein GB937_008487 [Aspergillus fischeri]